MATTSEIKVIAKTKAKPKAKAKAKAHTKAMDDPASFFR